MRPKTMVREVFPNVYLNEIPLPDNPLRAVNSYIILSDEKYLVMDTGFNMNACKEAFMRGVDALGVDLARTDLVLTHMHVDHSGLADDLRRLGCRVLINEKDGDFINYFRSSRDEMFRKLLEAANLDKDVLSFKPGNFGKDSTEVFEFTPIAEGDILAIGDYRLEVVDIPGHSRGHIGLYERTHKIFFSGDHILNEITPNVPFWDYGKDSLGIYLESLKKVSRLDIERVFPAHRSLITEPRKRIEELITHHEERLDEITDILRAGGRKTASQTAAEMRWDLVFDTWEAFPGPQKYFASSEALSHLEHLVFRGVLRRVKNNGVVYYEPV